MEDLCPPCVMSGINVHTNSWWVSLMLAQMWLLLQDLDTPSFPIEVQAFRQKKTGLMHHEHTERVHKKNEVLL